MGQIESSDGGAAAKRRFPARTQPVNILVVGLDNSGKTTLIDWLAAARGGGSSQTGNDVITGRGSVLPTVGFVARRFNVGSTVVTVFDMSGQGRYRPLWRYHLGQCDAIVFVVDSSDDRRLLVAWGELCLLLSDRTLLCRDYVPLLIVGNRRGHRQAATSAETTATVRAAASKRRDDGRRDGCDCSQRPRSLPPLRPTSGPAGPTGDEYWLQFTHSALTRCRLTNRKCHVVLLTAPLRGAELRQAFDWLLTQTAAAAEQRRFELPSLYFP